MKLDFFLLHLISTQFFFYLKEYFMVIFWKNTLSMEYNVAQMSAAASLGNTYSGGLIFDNFLA